MIRVRLPEDEDEDEEDLERRDFRDLCDLWDLAVREGETSRTVTTSLCTSMIFSCFSGDDPRRERVGLRERDR